MSQVKRSLLVYIPALAEAAQVLTNYGRIVGIDHEGTITYELEGDDEFELGRTTYEIEHSLETLTCGRESKIISARKERVAIEKKAARR